MQQVARKRIFDCFTLFNELELLKLRLHELYDHVDHFVITESNVTFSGEPKPLYFSDNREIFRPFLDKIRLIVVEDMPGGTDRWARENHQRSAIRRGLVDLDQNDIVMVSDVDEIVRSSTLEYVRANQGYFMFDMPMYQFHMNMRTVANGWVKVFAYNWALDDEVGDYNLIRAREHQTFSRFAGRNHRIENGGWHFTFLGGADVVREKLRAYSHTDEWRQQMLRPGVAEQQMAVLRDVGGGKQLEYREVDETFPLYLRNNLRHFLEIGYVKDAESRISDLVNELVRANRARQIAEDKDRYRCAELARAKELHPIGENLALGKPATQSSISRWSHGRSLEEDARGANNGVIREGEEYGFHTDEELNPWWQVDLVDEFLIQEVRLYNRKSGTANRLRHFSVLTSRDGTDWKRVFQKTDDAIFAAAPYVICLNPAERTRFVRIQLDGNNFLHFDQCLVFGRRPESGDPMSAELPAAVPHAEPVGSEAKAPEDAAPPVQSGRNGHVVEIDGLEVFVDQDKYPAEIRNAIYEKRYESTERLLATRLIRSGDKVLEAGTGIGVVSMTAARIVGAENVLTFDANPDIVADAQANFRWNGMPGIKAAIGILKNRASMTAGCEDADFYIHQAFWASRLGASPNAPGIVRTIKAPVLCLEEQIKSHEANVIICEIEGGEVELFNGADVSGVRTIIMKVHYDAAGEAAIEAVIRKLALDGFAVDLAALGQRIVVLRR